MWKSNSGLRIQIGDVMVLHADEAEYRKQGDEIVPRGKVLVTLEKPR